MNIKISLIGLGLASIFILSSSVMAEEQKSLAKKVLTHEPKHEVFDDKPYTDLDEDGVLDKKDFCLNSARGVEVNLQGCELDSDKDGIFDSIDQCPTTPMGIKVNFLGCEEDHDIDRVLDSKDQCPGTPFGTKVDVKGCKLDDDTDKDGVFNSIDQCPETPLGTVVNQYGCKPEMKVIVKITFPYASARIPTDQKPLIDIAMSQLKSLQHDEVVLITGHTDSRGDYNNNQKLSWTRANNVKEYINANFDISPDLVLIQGHSWNKPVATNTTEEGMRENRRVEFEVVNIKDIPKEASHKLPADMMWIRR